MRCVGQPQLQLSMGIEKLEYEEVAAEAEVIEVQGRCSNCVCIEDNVRDELLAMCRYRVDGKYGNIVECGFGRRFQVVQDKSHRYPRH